MVEREIPPMNLVSQRLVRLMVALAAVLLLATMAQAGGPTEKPAPRERVEDEAAIEKLLTGYTLYGRYVDGTPWMEFHSPDGRTAYHEHDCTYQGHWWTEYGKVCFRYEAFNNGVPSCFRLYRNGDELDFDQEIGANEWQLNAYTIDRKPGNPEHLPLEGQACVGV